MIEALEYEKIELGKVPADWRLDYLENLCTTSSGTTPSRSMEERYYRNGIIHWVKTMDLNNSIIFTTEELVTKIASDETSLRVYPVGTVLVAMYGGFNQIGRTGLLKVPAAVNQAITAIQTNPKLLVPEYLISFLNYKISYWKTVASSSRKDPNITSYDIKKFPIIFPSVKEQRAIATALSDVDALIASLDQLIAKKRDIKQATMQQLLTSRTRLPGFSGKWVVKKLGEIAEVDSDNLGSNTPLDYPFKYISLEDVDTGILKSYSETIFRDAPSRARRKVKKNDILASTVRPNLKSHLLITDDSPNLVCSTGFSVLRCHPTIANPSYVYFHLFANEIGRQVESLLTGSNYPAINGGDIKALQIPFPSLPEQQAIATVLSDMDAEIVALEQRREKTRALKQAMMQELLTGKKRLL